jgi:dipeptidyl aminopeptidase/acylaminoacyl peptidase
VTDATAYFAVSPVGILAYASGVAAPPPTNRPVWVDRSGRETPLPLPSKWYGEPRLSPDGRLLAVIVDEGEQEGIQIYDIERNVLSPLVPEPGRTFNPTWSPDGRRMAFTWFRTKTPRLRWRATDASGSLQDLTAGDAAEFPGSFSPDGRTLAFTRIASEGGSLNLWLLTLGEGKPEERPWLQGSFKQYSPMFSPDGRRIAYVSEESGRSEVYIRPLAGPERKVKVSNEGGGEPAWSRDGRDLFYRIGDKLMAVRIEASPSFAVSAPRAVLSGDWVRGGVEDNPRAYDVAPDGNRFLFLKPVPQKKEEPVTELQMVVDWPAAFARAPAGK